MECSVKIQTDLAFGIANKAWGVVDRQGNVLKIISMAGSRCYSTNDPEVLKRANRVRRCAKVYLVVENMEREAFLKFRTESRNELSKLGKIFSGDASCGEFMFFCEDDSYFEDGVFN